MVSEDAWVRVRGIRPCKAGRGGSLRLPGGSSRIRSADQVGAERGWASPWAFLCSLGSPCVFQGALEPSVCPSAPLEGIPSPGVHFGGIPFPWFVLCHAQTPALPLGAPNPWLCLLGLPRALLEPFGVHRTCPWGLGVPGQCESSAWGSCASSSPWLCPGHRGGTRSTHGGAGGLHPLRGAEVAQGEAESGLRRGSNHQRAWREHRESFLTPVLQTPDPGKVPGCSH